MDMVKNIVIALGVVACLAAGTFAVTSASPALSAQRSDIVSVDRTNKGDRLPAAGKRVNAPTSPYVSNLPRPPIGCESAFSRAAEPARAGIFGRCIS
jgi:hypothetical protein